MYMFINLVCNSCRYSHHKHTIGILYPVQRTLAEFDHKIFLF